MGWIYLLLAGVSEVAGTTAFRMIAGWSRPWPIVSFAVASAVSLLLLYMSLRTVPLGTAYAIWTGLGAAGTALVGIIWFGEIATTARIVLLMVLIFAIVGLKLIDG